MKQEIKHYGKSVNNLSQKERELLMIDTSMSVLLLMNHEGNHSKNHNIPDLAMKRCFLIADILGWDVESFSSNMDLIKMTEKTVYSFEIFLKDHDKNNN